VLAVRPRVPSETPGEVAIGTKAVDSTAV
jgi:hypothetical protein